MKKVVSLILVLAIVISALAGVSIQSNAGSYPLVIGVSQDASIGDECILVFLYSPSFKNEELIWKIYDPDENLVVDYSATYYNTSSLDDTRKIKLLFYTYGFIEGRYRVEVTKKFYSFYNWNTAPTVSTSHFYLHDDRDIGAEDKNKYNGSRETFLNLSNETVIPNDTTLCNAGSAWNRTYVSAENYYIQLQEMYLGETANTMVKQENMFNASSGSADAQWIFMKYHIENNSENTLDASKIFADSNFYKYSGNPIAICDTATISSGKRSSYKNSEIAANSEADIWVGLLIPDSNGMPYLCVKNGVSSFYLNTNPGLIYGSKQPGHTYKGKSKCDVCSAKDPNYIPIDSKLTLKHNARTANAIKVSWNNVKAATGYQVQISTKDGKKWDKYYNLKAGVTNYTFKSLAAGNAYKFRVRYYVKAADGKNHYSAWSKTLTSPTLPGGTSLTKVTAASKAFTANWKKNTAVTGYQVQYSLKSNFSGAKTVTVKSNKTLKTTVNKLNAKKVYYVRVRTYKTISKVNYFSTWSKAVKVKTK